MAILIGVSTCGVFAQVLQLSGGTSTLYQSQGGEVTLYGSDYSAKLGFGVVGGQLGGGATLSKTTKDATYTLGDDYVGLSLPTDVFSSPRYLLMTGAGIKTNRSGADIVAFGGMSSSYLGSSLFDGVRAQTPAAMVTLNRKLNSNWTSTTDILATHRSTILEGLQWSPSKDLKVAFSGGIGANQPYGAVSGVINRKWFDAKATYIKSGSEFHVIGIESQYAAEPTSGNVLVTVRPFKFLNFSAGSQNYLVPSLLPNGPSTSTLDQVSTGVIVDKVNITAGEFQSKYAGRTNNSTVFTATRELHSLRSSIQSTYIISQTSGAPATNLFLLTGKEEISSRLAVSETLTATNGNTSVNFGGTFISNLLTANVEYQTFYVPENIAQPFKQSIVVNLQTTFLGRLRVQGNTYVDQQGKLRYTTSASLIASRQGNLAAPRISIGRYVVRGRVVDPKGKGIEGAVVLVDALSVFTDSGGRFAVHENKLRSHRLTILTDQFMDARNYEVVAAPKTISSTLIVDDPGVVIVVKRIIPKHFCESMCD